jgi:lysophospholipase L1-like esterase
MSIAEPGHYLADVVEYLKRQWPDNRTVNIVCHGHSVPAGYFATPLVSTFDAYPHLSLHMLKARFPYAVTNVIVTAIGGEESASGARRFERDVLSHQPDVVTIDYGLNDRGIGFAEAERAWRKMIELSLARQVRVLLLTPTMDVSGLHDPLPRRSCSSRSMPGRSDAWPTSMPSASWIALRPSRPMCVRAET